MSSAVDKRQPPRSPQLSACHWTTTVTFITLIMTVHGATELTKSNLVHVVKIQVDRVGKPINTCPIMCTGTLITSTIVLTAASCTEQNHKRNIENHNQTEIVPRSLMLHNTSMFKRAWNKKRNKTVLMNNEYRTIDGIPVGIGTIRVYVSITGPNYERNVIRKFLNPEWDWKTKVADLVLLKMDSHFPHFYRTNIHSLINIDMTKIPQILRFKGFGKMNMKLYPEQPIDDVEANRNVHVAFTGKLCPYIGNDNVSSFDLNWWSFLCTDSLHTHKDVDSTLCNEDIGGPLYDMEDGLPRLYGVFSHAYHKENDLCATQLCYTSDTAPYPCETERHLLYYKHTALIEQYAYWVNRTIETVYQGATTLPTCQTKPNGTVVETTTTGPIDRMYDVNVYGEELVMMANYKVCPKYGAFSAAVTVATACRGTATVAVVAAMFATRSCCCWWWSA